MEPIIAPSARKHGVADADLLHAFGYAIRRFDLDEGLLMLIGPDRSARLLEVGVVMRGEVTVIVHAMPARRRFLR